MYAWIPRGIVQRQARLVSSVNISTDVLTLDDHGFALDDVVTFRGDTLPTGITAGTAYYAIPVTAATFQVAVSAGGAAIDLSGTMTGTFAIAALPWDAWIEEESATIDGTCPAHLVPFASTPAVVRKYVSALVAQRAVLATGGSLPALDTMLRDVIRPEFLEWRKGVTIRGTDEPTAAQVPQLYTTGVTASTREIT